MKIQRHVAITMFLAIVGVGVWFAASQESDVKELLGERPVKDFVVHDDDFMIQGEQAFLQANEFVRIEGITVETRRKGEINLTIATPLAIYDMARTNVRSSSPITVQSTDERFLLSGEGYSLYPKTQRLNILSNVMTRFDRSFFAEDMGTATSVATNDSGSPFSVRSTEFYFDGLNGDAEYRDGVRMSDGGGLTLDAGMLRLNVAALTNDVREVRAIQDVVISLNTSNGTARASSHEAILSTEPEVDGRLTLIGNPTWEQGLMSGGAGLIQLVVISNQFDVLGTNRASMRFPATLFETNRMADESEMLSWIDIQADHYRLTPGLMSFNDGVTVTQSTNWSANSHQMLAYIDMTNREPTRLEALGGFRFVVNQAQGRGEGRAGRAEFELNEEDKWLALLTDDPSWNSPELSTTATTIRILDPMGDQEVAADGKAVLTLSGELLAGMNWFETGTNRGGTAATRSQPVTISSERYDLNAERVMFKGDVLVVQSTNSLAAPELTLWFTPERRARKLYAERGVMVRSGPHTLFAQTLTALFDGPGNTVSSVNAVEDVEFRDQQILATGRTLTYESAMSEIVLDGNPVVIATKVEKSTEEIRRVRMDAPSITMNLTNRTVIGSAPFTIKTLPANVPDEASLMESTRF